MHGPCGAKDCDCGHTIERLQAACQIALRRIESDIESPNHKTVEGDVLRAALAGIFHPETLQAENARLREACHFFILGKDSGVMYSSDPTMPNEQGGVEKIRAALAGKEQP